MKPLYKSVFDQRLIPVWIGVLIALIYWTMMFGVGVGNFWLWMSIAIITLNAWSFYHQRDLLKRNISWGPIILWGLVSAVLLYGVFLAGDLLTRWIVNQEQQIVNIYATKSQSSLWLIGVLLLFLIGPGEEIFWRGFVQNRLSEKWGGWVGFLVAGLLYTAVHLPSQNLMLIGAAGICGVVWGLMYKVTGSVLPGIISHAVWDVAVFIVFPFK